ncbi:peptide ABC transporter substrate-binding protein [Desnuesiella massiliensis]|uniref:peptide ABC transporter substrate-binding protein n=1 Tax=Desnuesiella massiliensis TaxID=1650662 RepID=UPI0006E37CE8|nr:peptide ABC transporter substrate-binding protein [Desnuesiella massiliensis]
MIKRKLSKLSSLFLAFTLLATTLVGCTKKDPASETKTNVPQVIKYNLGVDPKTLDPALNAAVDGATVLSNAFEGLMKFDDKDQPIYGVAEKYEISKDNLSYTFYLRKDAKWSDGQPVKAQDFEYAWKRALNPDVAAEYAYQLYYLKNGEAYNTKKAKAEDVGVKAESDTVLKVNLEYPTAYFLSLMAFPTYFPVRKDIVEKDPEAWATKVESYVSNGAFKMTEWKPKDVIVFSKNENYWNSKEVKLDKIEYKMIEDSTSYLSAFKVGQLDLIETPPAQEVAQLLKDGIAKISPFLGTYFYCINLSENAEKVDPAAAKALKDPRVRKALTYAIDRKLIVENVTKSGQVPAVSFVSKGIPESPSKDFQSKEYFKPEGDIAKAKQLLAEAGYPDGKGFPKIAFLYNDKGDNKNIAQAIQDMWKKNLNIDMELKVEEWKVFQQSRNDKNYSIARHGWLADYVDPMTYLDMWTSNSGNNDAAYKNPEYDRLINEAKKEVDQAKRMKLLHDAEDILMNDMPIIPIYYYSNVVCSKDYVKGVRKSPLGFMFFDKAYVEKK